MRPSCARRMPMPTIRRHRHRGGAAHCRGVVAVLTGADLARLTTQHDGRGSRSMSSAGRSRGDRVRYVGEPVAIVVAEDRYLAEDALDLDRGRHTRPLPAVVDPHAASRPTRRCCIPRSAATSSTTAAFATAIRRPPSPTAAHRIDIDDRLSAQFLHADRDLRRHRRIRSRRGRLRRHGEFPGAVLDPCGDGARARRCPATACGCARRPIPAAASASSRASSPMSILIGVAARVAGASGQVDRGPARASGGLGLGHQPRHHARGRRRRPTAASPRWAGTSSRIAAPICARRSPPRSTACTAT